MRFTKWVVGFFVALFCITEGKLTDIGNDNRNVGDEKNNDDQYWTDTEEYKDARNIVDEKIELMDSDDFAEFEEDISYCMKRLDIQHWFSGSLKKMKRVCLNLLDLENCMNAVGRDFFGHDLQYLAKIYRNDLVFGKRAKSFMRYYAMFQRMCTEDSTLFRDVIGKIKMDNANCMKMLDFKNLFPGGTKKMEDICSNILDYFDCKDKFIMDTLGHDVAILETLFSGTYLGNNIRLYMNTKDIIRDMCSKDSIFFKDNDTTGNKDYAQCMKLLDIEGFLAGKFETVNDVCPNAFNFVKCVDDLLKDALGYDISILAKVSSGTSDMGKYSRYYMRFKNILQELCPKEYALLTDADVTDINEDVLRCLKMLDLDSFGHSSSEKLEDLCPNILNFSNCMEEYIKDDVGHDVAVIERLFSGTNLGNSIKFFTNLKSIAVDFCTKDSDIYRDYKMDEECFDEIYTKTSMDLCKNEAKVAYQTFSKIIYYRDKKDKECFLNGYILACSGTEIHEKCGKRAFNTYTEVIKKSDVFRLKYCSEPAFKDLKTAFLESLNFTTDRQELFRQVFELNKT